MAVFPMEEIQKKVPNIYEAVIVAALEARRINTQRLLEEERQAKDDDVEENEEGAVEKPRIIVEPPREKVTVSALTLLINGRLHYGYGPEKK